MSLPLVPRDYGEPLATLVDVDRYRELGPGVPNDQARPALEQLDVAAAFGARAVDDDMARCCLSGVWLLHDFLDASHRISQGIETPTGSFWHGVMHRREGDFSNAKYWFRRTGEHPVLEQLAQVAAEDGFLDWDPLRMVDACQEATSDQEAAVCRRVQQHEWELLFDYSYRSAVGE